MPPSDYEKEYLDVITYVRLRPGEHFLDAQSEPDKVPKNIASQIYPYGYVVSMAYGQKTSEDIKNLLMAQNINNVRPKLGHITKLPFKSGSFNGIIYRKTKNFKNTDQIIGEAIRVTKPGSKIVFCYTYWDINWKKDPPPNIKCLADKLAGIELSKPEDFLKKILGIDWIKLEIDTYNLAGNNKKHRYKYKQDWRNLLKKILCDEYYVHNDEIHDFINYIEKTKSVITAQRYIAIGQR